MARGFIGNRVGTAVTDGATGGQFSLDDNYYLMTRDTLHAPFSASGGNQANGAAPGNGYKYHTFTTSGSFVVSSGQQAVEVLCVGAGGGGGSNNNGGGGAGCVGGDAGTSNGSGGGGASGYSNGEVTIITTQLGGNGGTNGTITIEKVD